MSKKVNDASELVIERERQGRDNEQAESVRENRKPIADERGLSTAELIAKFRTEMFNNVLPRVPEIPGYHTCWLSLNHQNDPIAHRESQGYTRVTPQELPGMAHMTVGDGPYAGCIGHREMVLFKIPIEVYQAYMKIAHHERPYEQEERVRDTARRMREIAREGGADVYLGDGTSELVNARLNREPTFSE